jgi:hypothetical protein
VTEYEIKKGVLDKNRNQHNKTFFFFRNINDLPKGEAQWVDTYREAPDLLENLKKRIKHVYENSTKLKEIDVSFF